MEIKYNHEDKIFSIIDNGDEVVSIPFPYPDYNKPDNIFKEGNVSNYIFSIYYRKDLRELEYYEIFVNKIRIGWIIPLSALTTEDENLLKVQYLNEYVFWAYCHLLKKREIQDKINDSEEMSFSDILSELYPDGSLLIIEKGKMPEGKTEKSYELSLASNGYFKKQVNYRNPKIKPKSNNKLKLTSASEILNADGSYMNTYINEFLTKHVYNENSFIRFFYLYQIVEILLDAEMVELLRDYAKKIENNEVTFRTAENGLQKNTESERFKKIVERAGLFNKEIYNYNVFDNVCVKFVGLEEEKKEKEKEIEKGTKGVNIDKFKHPEIIYQVRNHIVHRFRKAIADEDTVKDICDHLELYLYDLLIAYKKPDANS